MERKEDEAKQLIEALGRLPEEVQSRLDLITALDDEEAAILRKGCSASSVIDPLARHLLDEWSAMSAHERVASLLALAAALRK